MAFPQSMGSQQQGGGFLSGLKGFATGSPAQLLQQNRFNPAQENALNQLLQKSLSGLTGSQFDFSPIEQRARSQFQQQTVPSIAERFTSLGDNALSSPAFASQLGQAGAGLEEGLGAQKAGYGLQQQNMLMQLLQMALQPQMDSYQVPQQEGFIQSILPTLLGLLGTAGGAYLGGPAGASIGGSLGSSLGKGF